VITIFWFGIVFHVGLLIFEEFGNLVLYILLANESMVQKFVNVIVETFSLKVDSALSTIFVGTLLSGQAKTNLLQSFSNKWKFSLSNFPSFSALQDIQVIISFFSTRRSSSISLLPTR